jgi:hypothetical protein
MDSLLTRRLINAGLRRPASPEPLTDATEAVEAALRSLRAGKLAEACAHLDNAKHAISAAQIRSGRAA